MTLGNEKENAILSLKGTSKSTVVGHSKLYYFEMSSLGENPCYSEPLLVTEGEHLDASIHYIFNIPYNVVEVLRNQLFRVLIFL